MRTYRNWASFSLACTWLVIVGGAYVRATGSGDGCGDHWPSCHGRLLPPAAALQTVIEWSHRLSSGIAWLAVLVLWLWARRLERPKSFLRRSAGWAFILMCFEALIGAALVRLRLVAHDTSVQRGYWMSAHLLNTFVLLAALTFNLWTAQHSLKFAGDRSLPIAFTRPARRHLALALWITTAVLMLLAGLSGGVAALGDTLFPSQSLHVHWPTDGITASHLWLRLRIWHPLIAIAAAVVATATVVVHQRWVPEHRAVSWLALSLLGAQVLGGFINLWLLAPVWMQLVHLALADALWVTLVWVGASLLIVPSIPPRLGQEPRRESPVPLASQH